MGVDSVVFWRYIPCVPQHLSLSTASRARKIIRYTQARGPIRGPPEFRNDVGKLHHDLGRCMSIDGQFLPLPSVLTFRYLDLPRISSWCSLLFPNEGYHAPHHHLCDLSDNSHHYTVLLLVGGIFFFLY